MCDFRNQNQKFIKKIRNSLKKLKIHKNKRANFIN